MEIGREVAISYTISRDVALCQDLEPGLEPSWQVELYLALVPQCCTEISKSQTDAPPDQPYALWRRSILGHPSDWRPLTPCQGRGQAYFRVYMCQAAPPSAVVLRSQTGLMANLQGFIAAPGRETGKSPDADLTAHRYRLLFPNRLPKSDIRERIMQTTGR